MTVAFSRADAFFGVDSAQAARALQVENYVPEHRAESILNNSDQASSAAKARVGQSPSARLPLDRVFLNASIAYSTAYPKLSGLALEP